MKKNYFAFFACSMLLFTSCAKHIIVNFQANPENTGKIVIAPTASIDGAVLTINDQLLVDKKFVKKITVNNVPIGEHKVRFSADSWAYKDKIDENIAITVQKDKEVAKVVTRPPYSTGYYVASGLSTVAGVLIAIFGYK
jgi:hypothetical protein